MTETRLTRTLNALVSELNRHADRILRDEFQITYSQFVFLVNLNEQMKVSVGSLAQVLSISQPAVSKKLPWFIEKGFIAVAADSQHKSKVIIQLTAKGRKLAIGAAQILEERFKSSLGFFKTSELDRLETQLTQILEHLRNKNGDRNGKN
jgi:DNA-binding MarR family transcriptional regulator